MSDFDFLDGNIDSLPIGNEMPDEVMKDFEEFISTISKTETKTAKILWTFFHKFILILEGMAIYTNFQSIQVVQIDLDEMANTLQDLLPKNSK